MVKLIKLQDGKLLEEFPITNGEFRIGRASSNDIVIHDDTVSQFHALISVAVMPNDAAGKTYRIQDLQSTNKTYVNDKAITEQVLTHKAIIRIGLSHFEFCEDQQEGVQGAFQRTTKLHKSWIPGVFYTKN